MAVVGDKESVEDSVALRDRIDGDLGMMKVDAAVAKLLEESEARQVRQVVKSDFAGLEGEVASENEY
jgi:threonyl-tRNA synthetase